MMNANTLKCLPQTHLELEMTSCMQVSSYYIVKHPNSKNCLTTFQLQIEFRS